MKYPKLRFVFDRKKVATKTKTGLIQIEVYSEGVRKWISTNIKVYSDQWDERRLIKNSPDMVELNNRLREQIHRIQTWVDDLVRRNEEFEFDKLNRFLNARLNSDKFIEYVEKRVEERADIKESTKKAHRKLVTSLKAFGGIVYFTDLTRKNILAYDEWLHKQNYVQTTIFSYHKYIKIYINDAIRHEIIERSPYEGLKFERGKSKTRKYLNENEIEKIANAQLSTEGLCRVRDLFLFQCYTGLAYSDLANFDFSKVVERGGKYIFVDTRQKTDELFYIVLLSPAVAILKKYNFELPVITNQQYNLQLKVVASFAGLDRPITSHMARHSFAVMALNNGVQIENLAKMMGHTDIKTTQIYAKILNTSVERAFEKLEQSLFMS